MMGGLLSYYYNGCTKLGSRPFAHNTEATLITENTMAEIFHSRDTPKLTAHCSSKCAENEVKIDGDEHLGLVGRERDILDVIVEGTAHV